MKNMTERVFTDKLTKPSEPALQDALGEVYTLYNRLNDRTSAYLKEWTFTKSSGWMLKVYDRKKSLFYLIPAKNEFKISMAIRENERDLFLRDIELEEIRQLLLSAKKFTEGYAIQFNVANADEFNGADIFIEKLIKIRN